MADPYRGTITGGTRALSHIYGQSSSASTNSEMDNLYRHVATEIGAVRSEMKGEIATVMAEITKAEAKTSLEFSQLKSSIDGVKTSLPTKGEMWKIVGSVVGGGMALLALLWTVFGAGASTTGVYAEQVLERKEQQTEIQQKLDKLLKAQSDDKPEASPQKR